jgi:hypothetical protein
VSTLLPAVFVVAVLVFLALAVRVLRTPPRLAEDQRFRHAAALTSSWARAGAPQPPPAEPLE